MSKLSWRSFAPLVATLSLGATAAIGGCTTTTTVTDAGTDRGFVIEVDAGPQCENGRRDGDESHVDCGGSCDPCEAGSNCAGASDCESAVCQRGYCLAPSCRDEVQNGREIGTDCGGDCDLCPGGQACSSNADCVSGRCVGAMCEASSCEDGRRNNDETDVDCGGAMCPGCAGDLACIGDDDCESLICASGTCTLPTCTDRVQNQDETSLDCGGATCPACRNGLACVMNSDCLGERCVDGGCVSCDDDIRNAAETDVDCGGDFCAACEDTQQCVIASDCRSNNCTGGVCIAPSCDDTIINAAETDLDCGGGTCAGCDVGQTCSVGRDCVTGVCTGGVCQAPTCSDGVANGGETDADCGGATACPRCADYRACGAPTDCTTAACTLGRCGTTGCIPFPGTSTDAFGYFGCTIPMTPATLPCPDISTTGTTVTLDDESSQSVPIGFSFDFYGTSYTNATIQSNGVLTFDAGTVTWTNACLPTASTPRELIAPFWDDLYPVGATTSVRYQTLGTAPNRQFVVRWETLHCCGGTDTLLFSVVLQEGSDHIQVCYYDVHSTYEPGSDRGALATVGINGAGGTRSLQFSCDTASLSDGLLIEYRHP